DNNPVIFGATAETANTGLQFVGNNVHDNAYGVYSLKVINGLFQNNDISTTAAGATGLIIADGSTNVQILNNNLANNLRGLRVGSDGYGVTTDPISGVVAHYNDFSDSTSGSDLVVFAGDYSGTLDASSNYWGTSDPVTVAASIDATGTN